MLMRVQETTIDYNHVQAHHEAIHARLENWARWVRVRTHGWQTSPMFRMYQSRARQWEAPVIQNPVDTLDAVLLEKAVSALPEKHRAAVRWSYVHAGNPVAMARALAVSKQGLSDLVGDGRTMLQNRLR
jgi:DNA-directed RNA polymerase specialized sigma24 family protein